MKKYSLIVALLISLFGFSQEYANRFPEEFRKMFDSHGSYKLWENMNQLQFDLIKKDGVIETHLVDLESRKTLIESSSFTIGFDGNDVWMNKEGKFPIEKARFYHNLYFYFYAMPFVLGDPGITYYKIKDLDFKGKKYSGFKISYGDNIGDSPDDNYFIYFDKRTFKMVWLGYTVTYGDDKPNTEIHYIKYNDWVKVDGLVLPKTLQWYDSKNNLPNLPTNRASFEKVIISENKVSSSRFNKLEGALIGKK